MTDENGPEKTPEERARKLIATDGETWCVCSIECLTRYIGENRKVYDCDDPISRYETLADVPEVAELIRQSELRAYQRGVEDAASLADEWTDPQALKLAAGEMTAQEERTALAVASGLGRRIRNLKPQT